MSETTIDKLMEKVIGFEEWCEENKQKILANNPYYAKRTSVQSDTK